MNKTTEFKKEVHVRPAFDKRDDDPKKDYGIHGAELAFYLIGEKGVIQFVIYTNWMLPHVQEEMDTKPLLNGSPYMFHKPLPADIGYHSPKPIYEGQEPIHDNYHLIGGECYYDGSGLMAEDVFRIMIEGGSDAMWADMERRYNDIFEEKPE